MHPSHYSSSRCASTQQQGEQKPPEEPHRTVCASYSPPPGFLRFLGKNPLPPPFKPAAKKRWWWADEGSSDSPTIQRGQSPLRSQYQPAGRCSYYPSPPKKTLLVSSICGQTSLFIRQAISCMPLLLELSLDVFGVVICMKTGLVGPPALLALLQLRISRTEHLSQANHLGLLLQPIEHRLWTGRRAASRARELGGRGSNDQLVSELTWFCPFVVPVLSFSLSKARLTSS